LIDRLKRAELAVRQTDAPPPSCPAGSWRPLTPGEIALARSVFGDAIDYAAVTVRRRQFMPFQPRGVTMAPMGHLHFHPEAGHYRDDFAAAPLSLQGHFIHEMTHVWQAQQRGRWYLVTHRHPWCRYSYALRPGWKLERYGIEQQAEIVRHFFLLCNRVQVAGAASLESYRAILPFTPA
jgi:hypothetical protein